MDERQALQTDVLLELVERLVQTLCQTQVIARSKGVRCVQAHPEPSVASESVEQAPQLGEPGAQGVTRTGRILEQNGRVAAATEHLFEPSGHLPLGFVHRLAAA